MFERNVDAGQTSQNQEHVHREADGVRAEIMLLEKRIRFLGRRTDSAEMDLIGATQVADDYAFLSDGNTRAITRASFRAKMRIRNPELSAMQVDRVFDRMTSDAGDLTFNSFKMNYGAYKMMALMALSNKMSMGPKSAKAPSLVRMPTPPDIPEASSVDEYDDYTIPPRQLSADQVLNGGVAPSIPLLDLIDEQPADNIKRERTSRPRRKPSPPPAIRAARGKATRTTEGSDTSHTMPSPRRKASPSSRGDAMTPKLRWKLKRLRTMNAMASRVADQRSQRRSRARDARQPATGKLNPKLGQFAKLAKTAKSGSVGKPQSLDGIPETPRAERPPPNPPTNRDPHRPPTTPVAKHHPVPSFPKPQAPPNSSSSNSSKPPATIPSLGNNHGNNPMMTIALLTEPKDEGESASSEPDDGSSARQNPGKPPPSLLLQSRERGMSSACDLDADVDPTTCRLTLPRLSVKKSRSAPGRLSPTRPVPPPLSSAELQRASSVELQQASSVELQQEHAGAREVRNSGPPRSAASPPPAMLLGFRETKGKEETRRKASWGTAGDDPDGKDASVQKKEKEQCKEGRTGPKLRRRNTPDQTAAKESEEPSVEQPVEGEAGETLGRRRSLSDPIELSEAGQDEGSSTKAPLLRSHSNNSEGQPMKELELAIPDFAEDLGERFEYDTAKL